MIHYDGTVELEREIARLNTEVAELRNALALLGAECRAWRRHEISKALWTIKKDDDTIEALQASDMMLENARLATDSSPTAAAAVKGST